MASRDRTETGAPKPGKADPRYAAETGKPAALPRKRSRAQLVLNLQRQVGNRAVAALVGLSPKSSTPISAAADVAGPLGEVVIQRDFVSDARNLLEYSGLDWAITDDDATQALAKLAQIPSANLKASLTKLGAQLVGRLFENLPTSAKKGTGYARVVTAAALMGAADVPDAWKGIGTAAAADRRSILVDQVTLDDLGTLVTGATADNHTGVIDPFLLSLPRGDNLDVTVRGRVRKIFDTCRNAQVTTLTSAMVARFDISFGGIQNPDATEHSTQWEAAGLRRMYPVLEALPSAHVARNAMLTFIGRYMNKNATTGATSNPNLTEGWWWGAKEIGLAYDPALIAASNAGTTDAGDPLANVNRFDSSVRHEVGHAVDNQIGWSAGAEPAKTARGGWTVYGTDHDRCARAMINSSDGAIARRISRDKRSDIRAEMVAAMANRNPVGFDAAIALYPWWPKLSANLRNALLNDRAIVAMKAQFVESGPWWAAGGGTPIGKYVYHESYTSMRWVRYKGEARAWKVSTYQFRAPGEWFAEAYAAYYEPDARGVGAKLNDVDPSTKKYFDDVVAKAAPSR